MIQEVVFPRNAREHFAYRVRMCEFSSRTIIRHVFDLEKQREHLLRFTVPYHNGNDRILRQTICDALHVSKRLQESRVRRGR